MTCPAQISDGTKLINITSILKSLDTKSSRTTARDQQKPHNHVSPIRTSICRYVSSDKLCGVNRTARHAARAVSRAMKGAFLAARLIPPAHVRLLGLNNRAVVLSLCAYGGRLRLGYLHQLPHPVRRLLVGLGRRRLHIPRHYGRPLIGAGAHVHMQRDLPQQLHVLRVRQALAAVLPEDVAPGPAAGTHMVAHVLQQPQHGHVDLAKQCRPSHRICQRNVLRGGDDDGAAESQELADADLGVPCSVRRTQPSRPLCRAACQ